MVLEMAMPTAEAPKESVRATDSSAVATTMMAPNRSHQKDSHRWVCEFATVPRSWHR